MDAPLEAIEQLNQSGGGGGSIASQGGSYKYYALIRKILSVWGQGS